MYKTTTQYYKSYYYESTRNQRKNSGTGKMAN